MSGFDNPWYAGIIDRFNVDSGTVDDPPNANSVDGHGRAIIVAACVIAQAIDGLAEATKEAAKDIQPPN